MRATAVHLFRSSVDSSSTSSRKQKTGYCRPSSLSRSTFILRLNFCRGAAVITISTALWSPRVTCALLHMTVKHMTSRCDRPGWKNHHVVVAGGNVSFQTFLYRYVTIVCWSQSFNASLRWVLWLVFPLQKRQRRRCAALLFAGSAS